MVWASMRGLRPGALWGLLCLCMASATVALADDSAASLAAAARAECEAGRRAEQRDERKAHFDRGQTLGEQAVALDDLDADAHFALFCNLGELMRLDGESI